MESTLQRTCEPLPAKGKVDPRIQSYHNLILTTVGKRGGEPPWVDTSSLVPGTCPCRLDSPFSPSRHLLYLGPSLKPRTDHNLDGCRVIVSLKRRGQEYKVQRKLFGVVSWCRLKEEVGNEREGVVN